jgi:hypothetical protein
MTRRRCRSKLPRDVAVRCFTFWVRAVARLVGHLGWAMWDATQTCTAARAVSETATAGASE